jgi:threonine dehydrogenase-like Zn-dependent dehydrogenase
MATAGARLLGAGKIFAVDAVEKRLDLAGHFGADVLVNFRDVDPVETII